MKQLDLPQIEISLVDGSVRLVVFRVLDGERFPTPHLVGLMPETDPTIVLENVRQHLEGQGYAWVDQDVLDRAMKHRELILADPVVRANIADRAAKIAEAQAADEAERAAADEAAKAAQLAEETRIQARIDDAVKRALDGKNKS